MPQPPAYTPASNFAQDEAANLGGRSTVGTAKVDAELAALALTIAAIRANLALMQRDDGLLLDGIVQPFHLSAATKAFALATKWTARGIWSSGVVYAVNDLVDFGGAAYVCAVAHTGGVFATDYEAGRWQIFAVASSAGGVTFTPTPTVTSANVQSAVVEVDTKLRAASLPELAGLYGGF